MRSGLQSLPARSTPLRILRTVIGSQGCPANFALTWVDQAAHRGVRVFGGRKNSGLALVVSDGGHERSAIGLGNSHRSSSSPNKQAEIRTSWKSRLVSFEQYEHESQLGDPLSKGSRLVDNPVYGTDFDLWLELIWFRRRQRDIEGSKAIWKEIRSRDLRLPNNGAAADELWDQFLQFGWETHSIWENIIPYARRIRESTGQVWENLYVKILSHCLKAKPRTAYRWHERLYKEFPPSLEQVKQLFRQVVSNEPAFAAFKGMYIDLPTRDMYDTIIPQLCSLGKYAPAVKWHNLMIRLKDLPSSSRTAEPLLRHLAIYGDQNRLMEMSKGMVDAGVSFASISQNTGCNTPITREMMNRQLGETHGIAPKVVSDEFCARLFATTLFSVDTVINGLRILGVDNIGPLSLRELVMREGISPEICQRRIDQLKSAGISLGRSTFSTLVNSLALRSERRLLEDLINCDMHPEACEDRELQESLLMSYHQSGDRRQVNRTLAILTAKCSPKSIAGVQWNVLLRSALKRQDKVNAYQILEAMQEHQVPVSARSSSYVKIHLLSERQVSRRPTNTNDLPGIIAIFQRILRTGGVVRPSEWREILRRLGMAGQLIEFEKISLWLADWYSNPTAQASQQSRHITRGRTIPRYLSSNHPRNPLRILFPAVAQQAIIAWGFQHPGDIENRVTKLRNKGLSWRWGLELLRKLKQRKVVVLRYTVARACHLRLRALFGVGISNRKINRPALALNSYHMEYFVEEMEKVWGETIFRDEHSLLRADPRRMGRLRVMAMGKPLPYVTENVFLQERWLRKLRTERYSRLKGV